MNAARAAKFLFLFSLVLQSAGCASSAQRMDHQAITFGYRKMIVSGEGFDHIAYVKEGHTTNAALHVYLEGDGSPWLRRRVAAIDPTPRNALMFQLMRLDAAPSLYLGRPCYHGLNKSIGCTASLWTDQRYSDAVVTSMTRALERLTKADQPLILLGYSGGGTLAMLLAERFPQTRAVVTVAANLDTDRWAALHKQQPLSGSLNPATRPPLPAPIKQLHVAGELDNNVPPDLIRQAIAQQPGAVFKIIPRQNHRCCWREVWPSVLATVDSLVISP